jgi:hypothetical protein
MILSFGICENGVHFTEFDKEATIFIVASLSNSGCIFCSIKR